MPRAAIRVKALMLIVCYAAVSSAAADMTFWLDFTDFDASPYGFGGQEAALALTLTRGVASAAITLPRVLYTGSEMGLPGAHDRRIVERVEFTALGSVDGVTAPVTLA